MQKSIVRKKVLWRWSLSIVGIGAVYALWNGPLLWSVSKPTVIRVMPHLFPAPVQAANASVFEYQRLGIQAPAFAHAHSSPLNFADWSQISQDLHNGVNISFTGDQFSTAPLVYITGHSSDTYPHPFASVFAALSQAQPRDTFTVRLEDTEYTFTVEKKKVVHPTDEAAFQEHSDDPHIQTVLLVTCTPLLTSRDRLIVVGKRAMP